MHEEAKVIKKARPTEMKKPLLNPHKGMATFQHFNGDPLFAGKSWSESGPTEFPPREHPGVTPGYLPATLVYCRWFWDLFEPKQGKLDFSVIDKALATAHERGQTLQVRLMPHGSHSQPQLPQWYRDKYPVVPGPKNRGPYFNAVYDGPDFIREWGKVITEFGKRYDGHPDLESADVSFIGAWGEGAGECSEEGVDTMIDIYRQAHPKTPLMTMISGHKMTAGVRAGMGWRLDCFGDVGIFGTAPRDVQWMHHFDCYPCEVCECGAQDAWKKAPITFESCGVPMTWFDKGFDLEFILQQGLKFHGTVLMPKSAALPEMWMDRLERFCNDLGYRFVLRQFVYEGRPERGVPFEYTCWVENVGVAPIYHRYPLVIRLTQGKRVHVVKSKTNILKWLPGDVWLREKMTVPKSFKPGVAELSAGLVDPATDKPKIRFAVEGSDAEGWVPLGTVEVV